MIGHARLPAALVERRRRTYRPTTAGRPVIDPKYDTRTKLIAPIHTKLDHHARDVEKRLRLIIKPLNFLEMWSARITSNAKSIESCKITIRN
jgi:hypothetical protein